MSMEGPPVNDSPTLFVKASPSGGIGDCPFSQKANLALQFRSVDFVVHPIDLSNKPQWFVDLNEAGSTPVLLDGATALGESDDIVDYADTLNASTATSAPVLNREDDPNWDGAFDAVSPVFGSLVRLLKAKEEAELPTLTDALTDALRSLNAFLQKVDGPFLLGEEVSALDCNLAPKLQHISVAAKYYRDYDIPDKFKAVHAYLDMMHARDEWKATACDDDVIVWGWSKFF